MDFGGIAFRPARSLLNSLWSKWATPHRVQLYLTFCEAQFSVRPPDVARVMQLENFTCSDDARRYPDPLCSNTQRGLVLSITHRRPSGQDQIDSLNVKVL